MLIFIGPLRSRGDEAANVVSEVAFQIAFGKSVFCGAVFVRCALIAGILFEPCLDGGFAVRIEGHAECGQRSLRNAHRVLQQVAIADIDEAVVADAIAKRGESLERGSPAPAVSLAYF